ncbi:hypothetical protein [Azospirillum melinis]
MESKDVSTQKGRGRAPAGIGGPDGIAKLGRIIEEAKVIWKRNISDCGCFVATFYQSADNSALRAQTKNT